MKSIPSTQSLYSATRPELPGLSTLVGRMLEKPLLFGHRGLSAKAPENTMAAFRALLATGIPGVECDVQLTQDKHMVIHHDYTLGRTGGVDMKLAETPLLELKKHSVGSWFSPEFQEERIPLLADLFKLGGKTLYYDVEIKEPGYSNKELVTHLGNLIRTYNLEDHVLVSSFNPLVLREFGKAFPDIPRGCIYSAHDEVPWYLRTGLGQFISGGNIVKPHHPIALEKLEKKRNKHKRGQRSILTWTVNTREEARKLSDQGVWGIISDDPTQLD